MPWSGDWVTENRIQISYASRGNKDLKNRLVLQDGQKTDDLNICKIGSVSAGSCEVAFQEVSVFEMLATLGDP